jgi:hypothetical protein
LPHFDAELATIVAAWSELPEALKAGIIAMVKAGISPTRLPNSP